MVHQITEVRLLIGLEVPSKYDLVASRKKNIRQEAVFILPLVPQAAWVSTQEKRFALYLKMRFSCPLGAAAPSASLRALSTPRA